jgi:predicted phosphodiesterase
VGARLAIAAGCVCIAVAGSALGMRVAGAGVHDTALGEVSLTVEPAVPGRVDVFIPLANWGIRSGAIDAPLAVNAQARSIERSALLRAAGGERDVLDAARSDVRDAAESALLRAVLWAVLGTLAVAIVLALAAGERLGTVRRRALLGAGCVATAFGLTGGSALLAALTFDASSFDQPEFYARGAELNQLLDVAQKSQAATEGYTSSVDRTLSGYAKLLAGAARLAEREEPDSVVLASDLHGNTPVIDALADVFTGQPVFLAGDLGHDGSAAEADLLVPRLSRLGDEVIAVSGNHDSSLMMDRLAAAGVSVLDESETIVAGRRVAGWPDPLEWRGERPDDPERIFSFAELPDGDEAFDRAEAELIAWFGGLDPMPDIVMVHQNGLAQGLARHVAQQPGAGPLTILTGHDHVQHVDRYEQGVVVVDAGSTGAGGVFGLTTQEAGIASIHFTSAGLRAVDMIQIDPISGAARAERIVLDSEDACDKDLLICRDAGEED